MAPVNTVNQTATELVERLITNISIMLVRRRLSGRDLSMRLGGSHNWLSKRRTGAQSFTIEDLVAIAEELETTVGELLGIQSAVLSHPVAQEVDDFLDDGSVPRSVKDDMLGALGHLMRLGYQMTSRSAVARKAPAQRRAR